MRNTMLLKSTLPENSIVPCRTSKLKGHKFNINLLKQHFMINQSTSEPSGETDCEKEPENI